MIRTPPQHQTDPAKAPGFFRYSDYSDKMDTSNPIRTYPYPHKTSKFDEWYNKMEESGEGWWVLDYDKAVLRTVFNAGLSFQSR
jgi:hypothetical protein